MSRRHGRAAVDILPPDRPKRTAPRFSASRIRAFDGQAGAMAIDADWVPVRSGRVVTPIARSASLPANREANRQVIRPPRLFSAHFCAALLTVVLLAGGTGFVLA